MAAVTRTDSSDTHAFDAHYERISQRLRRACCERFDDDGELAGTAGSFTMEGERSPTWTTPARWGQGLASRALGAFPRDLSRWPLLRSSGASYNAASAKGVGLGPVFVEVGRRNVVRARSTPRSSSSPTARSLGVAVPDWRDLIPCVHSSTRRASPWARIGEVIGHADLVTTARTYTHVLVGREGATTRARSRPEHHHLRSV